MIPLRDDLSHD
jgi:hypothetical protein